MTRGLPLGIDFSGGTLAVVEFTQDGVTEEQVRAAVAGLPGDEIVQRYGAPADRQFLIRLPLGVCRTATPWRARSADRAGVATRQGCPSSRFEKRELVSAMIGSDLQRRGIYAVAASLAAIARLYRHPLSLRVCDGGDRGHACTTCSITLACVSLAGYDLSLNVVAALLTIIGYSVNDTIVIFDRVRENAKRMPGRQASTRSSI